MQVKTKVPRLRLLPTDLRQTQVFRSDTLHAVVITVARILVVDEPFGKRSITVDTPARAERKHVHIFAERLEESFIRDIPTSRNTGEEAPLVTRTELRHTFGTKRKVKHVLRTESIVHRTGSIQAAVTPRRRIGTGQEAGHRRVCDTSRDTRVALALRRQITSIRFKTPEDLERMVRILKVRTEQQ